MNLIKNEFVFSPENSPFDVCHASNICLLANGDILVVWFGGSVEGADDTAIWMARQSNEQWNAPLKIAQDSEDAHWNPVLFQQKNGTLLLFYKVGRDISKWVTKIRLSNDNGITWSEPKELVEGDLGGRGPVRNKLVELSDGSLIAGASIEEGIWSSFADRSTDGGKTWMKSNPIIIQGVTYNGEKTVVASDIEVSEQSFYGRGVIQPTIWESALGHVHMLLRSTEGLIYKADSSDFGQTWGEAYETVLPNNNSGIDVVKLNDGKLVLCYNPVGENWGPRSPISLSTSSDNGKTWSAPVTLEDAPGEFSYPSIITDEENIYVSYTWKRKSIVVTKLHANV